MLILENITIQAAKRVFSQQSQRFLRLSINEHTSLCKGPAKFISKTTLEIEQALTIPLFFNQEYSFQLFEKHAFGYNPEELTTILSGSLVVGANDSFNSWEIFADKKMKFGFLSAHVRTKNKFIPNAIAPAQSQVLNISSIIGTNPLMIAHLPNLKFKRAFAKIKIGNGEGKTQLCKSKAGQLLFVDPIMIEKTDQDQEITVSVFAFDVNQEREELIAEGQAELSTDRYDQKLIVRNVSNKEVGQIFIDYRITDKQIFQSSKLLARIIQKGIGKINEPDRSEPEISKKGKTLSLSRMSRLFHETESFLSKESPHKKNSVINRNNNIIFPKEKRFTDFSDRQNHKISYLQGQARDFEFKEKQSKLFYRGASIGKGDKEDFTKGKSNPGVGRYHLPSIWDRY